VDAGKGTITLAVRAGRGEDAQEKTFTLARDADVLLDTGRGGRGFARAGKLADLKPGALAVLKLSLDQKTAVLVRAEGPTVYGTLKSVDAGKGTVTVLVGAGRGSDGQEKTFTLGKKAKVFHAGKEVKLADLKAKADAIVLVRLSLDQKVAVHITLPGDRE
jgi:hypothetical protein